jgi:tetratricopeptide (TPR) repeat protein
MSGDATFTGTTYQARVIGFVYVHLLAQTPLGWLPNVDDTPNAVSGETKGAGDDIRIKVAGADTPVEVQAKHGLNAAGELDALLSELRDALADPKTAAEMNGNAAAAATGTKAELQGSPYVLTVDRGSTRALYTEFAEDLTRLRTGRDDGARQTLRRLLNADPTSRAVLERVFVVAIDVDHAHQPEFKQAIALLASILEDPKQAVAAWAVLVADADEICARRLRRDRKALVDILAVANIPVKPLSRDEKWVRQLDFTRDLLKRGYPAAALAHLRRLAAQLRDVSGADQVDRSVRYRLAQQQAAALRQLDRAKDALVQAQEALEVDPDGVHAMVIAAAAAADLGELELARAYAQAAVGKHPNNPHAWGSLVQVARRTGENIAEPPANVVAMPDFRLIRAHIAMAEASWEEALNLTAGLLEVGERSDDLLYIRISALLNVQLHAPSPLAPDSRIDIENAERLATELIDRISDDTHAFVAKTYVMRSHARRRLGREEDADADLAHVGEVAADDFDGIRHTANVRLAQGRTDEALAILRHPAVDHDAVLLALRARLMVDLGKHQEAKATLSQLSRILPDARYAHLVRAGAAETELLLGDIAAAKALLAGVSKQHVDDPSVLVPRARLAFAENDVETGESLFRLAAAKDVQKRTDYLGEIADQLRRAGHLVRSVDVFREAIGTTPIADLPIGLAEGYVIALMKTESVAGAQTVVDGLLRTPSPPLWAVGLAYEIAVRRDNLSEAISHLETLVARDGANPRVRFALIRWLIELERIDEARAHIDWLKNAAGLSPRLRMQLAQLLQTVGDTVEATSLAFQAFREGGTDPALHRAFISITLLGSAEPLLVDQVGPDTHATLRRADRETKGVTVFAGPPIDPRRNEWSVNDARAAGLLGRRVGDVIVLRPGAVNEERWSVEAIMSAAQFAANDAASHYAEWFPDEPFFIASFSIGKGDQVRDLTPLIASLEQRKTFVVRVFDAYRDHTLPLGFVARTTGHDLVDAMRYLSDEGGDDAPLLAVEWADRAGQDESRLAATDAREFVLTRSAIETADRLGLLAHLTSNYKLIAPRSLRDVLVREVQEANKHVTAGLKNIGSSSSGFSLVDIPAGDGRLIERRDRALRLLDWFQESVAIEPRPIEAITLTAADETEEREIIGADSMDAVDLARYGQAAMYADDLGLRRFFVPGAKGRSCSSVGVVRALADRGALTNRERDELLLSLVEMRYGAVPVTVDLLEAAVRRSVKNALALRRVFTTLASADVSLDETARVIAQFLHRLLTAPVQLFGVAEATQLALRAMAPRWGSRSVAIAIRKAVRDALYLVPETIREVEGECEVFEREDALNRLRLRTDS